MIPRRLTERPWASDSERRRAFMAAAVVLLAAALGLSALRPSSGQRTTGPTHASAAAPTPTLPSPTIAPFVPAVPPAASVPSPVPSRVQVNRTQDAQNRDPRFRARVIRDLRERPAFQHLPYQAGGVRIDLGGISGGRLMLSVTYHGHLIDAQRSYRRFLSRYRDPGRAYHPTYRPQP